jgi:hypothetical protein
VQKAARASGGTTIFSGEFEDRLMATLIEETVSWSAGKKEEEEDDSIGKPRFGVKKGNPFRRSKSERKRIAKLRKL